MFCTKYKVVSAFVLTFSRWFSYHNFISPVPTSRHAASLRNCVIRTLEREIWACHSIVMYLCSLDRLRFDFCAVTCESVTSDEIKKQL